jgi:hypothetical protein
MAKSKAEYGSKIAFDFVLEKLLLKPTNFSFDGFQFGLFFSKAYGVECPKG